MDNTHRMKLRPRGPATGIMQLPEEMLLHILGFVTFADIKSARLVSKYWRQVTTTKLRKSSRQISVDHSVFECVTKMNDGLFPVNSLEVRVYDDTEETKMSYVSSYIPGICSWVKELTLKMEINTSKYTRIPVRRADMTFLKGCTYPNLTNFELLLYETTSRTPQLWKGFVDVVGSICDCKNGKSPNLRDVNITYLDWNPQKRNLFPMIEDLFPNCPFTSLSYMNLKNVPLQKIDLAKWSTLNLKLKKLGINLSRWSYMNHLLSNFLETQTGTLKELILYIDNCYSKPQAATFKFPRMEKLEQLGFRSSCMFNTPVRFPGIDYPRLFPCLKKLNLDEFDIEWKDFLGSTSLKPTNNVKELILPMSRDKCAFPRPFPVATASRVFTGLRKLVIYANHFVTEAVYENMPNLEVLTIRGLSTQPLDDLITGLELEVCKTFEGVMTDTWLQRVKAAEGRSMARLQKLKTVKMFNFSGKLICFSRLSFHVLQQISSLECLDLLSQYNDSNIRYYNDNLYREEKQLLEELREKFVVI